jgi:23S rRNA pseudouridine1911/1915/1917 synthase
MLKKGDKVAVVLAEEAPKNFDPEEIPLDIIYEDEYLLAVNKPANMLVHPNLSMGAEPLPTR